MSKPGMSGEAPRPASCYVGVIVGGCEAIVEDNPIRDDLAAVRIQTRFGDVTIQGTLADVRTFVESALDGLDEVERQRASVAEGTA